MGRALNIIKGEGMKTVKINISSGDVNKIAKGLVSLSGVVAVHTENNNITAYCGDRLADTALLEIVNKMQSGNFDDRLDIS